ncbi:hypothetical protein AcV5_009863 [Taiwanofungus camphoratus]|nr:hypothetical protein AcV5_009863 [Antrodia cinnamomea]
MKREPSVSVRFIPDISAVPPTLLLLGISDRGHLTTTAIEVCRHWSFKYHPYLPYSGNYFTSAQSMGTSSQSPATLHAGREHH